MLALQSSLFDTAESPTLGDLERRHRRFLDETAWLDLVPGWACGSDEVLDTLLHEVPWRAERRQMYDSVVDVPRLTCFYGAGAPLPHPLLTDMRERLSQHYAAELGEPFVTAGLCLYRHGEDSVAWHGDRIGRSRDEDTMVAIVSLGSARHLTLRPRDGGRSQRVALGHGDLVVMGGACQRTWDHAVPKTSAAVGPRVSIQFRVAGVR
ncbi:DNA repair protein [Janibacter sp. Soil728]|uniref:alpha-ketoglutarate-dependent dioxygenase AlkB n=1 Tax=Janibacter sp. Soil728 TaxID=1736393 RepID=UPI0006FE02C4|nr:alpha-ketoglutarate-dependent dioxygenase AlkB [Janibacter sp. Soil728]KRE37949.1 DNA repair protein [Janibacter sp. Soil728]